MRSERIFIAQATCRRRIDRRAALAAAKRAVSCFDERAARALLLRHCAGRRAEPWFLTQSPSPRFTLALAHSAGHAVAAAAPRGARIGVDLERNGGVDLAHVRYFAGPEEQRAGVDATALWALKEAAWKALGLAAATPFRALRLELRPGARLHAVRLDGERIRATARLWAPWPGWTAAFVELTDAPAGARAEHRA